MVAVCRICFLRRVFQQLGIIVHGLRFEQGSCEAESMIGEKGNLRFLPFTVILIISRISCINPLQCFNYPSLNM